MPEQAGHAPPDMSRGRRQRGGDFHTNAAWPKRFVQQFQRRISTKIPPSGVLSTGLSSGSPRANFRHQRRLAGPHFQSHRGAKRRVKRGAQRRLSGLGEGVGAVFSGQLFAAETGAKTTPNSAAQATFSLRHYHAGNVQQSLQKPNLPTLVVTRTTGLSGPKGGAAQGLEVFAWV